MAQTSDYRRAYDAAKKELTDLLSQQEQIGKRLVVVRQSIQTLATLCESEGIYVDPSDEAAALLDSFTLADEIRVFLNANYLTWLRPGQIKSALERLGRDLTQYKNPQATIHMVLKRMAESEEVQEGTDGDGKTIYMKPRPTHPSDHIKQRRRIVQIATGRPNLKAATEALIAMAQKIQKK